MLGRVAVLAAAVFSGALAAECQDAACAAKAQHLLQKSQARKTLVSNHASNLDTQFAIVETFVDLLSEEGRNLTSDQMGIIAELNRTFYEDTIPTIRARQQNDELLLRQHAAGVGRCDIDLEDSSLQASMMNQAAEQAAAASSNCTTEEMGLYGEHTAAVNAMTGFLTEQTPPTATMPEPRSPTPEMDMWVLENMVFYRSFNASYYGHKETVMRTESAYTLKVANCSTVKSSEDQKYCSWTNEIALIKSAYTICRDETITVFRQTLSSARSNEEGRKSDWMALAKIQCYLRVLLSSDPDAAANIHLSCDTNNADTSALDIQVPDLPPYAEDAVAGLGMADASRCEGGESLY